jgi:hypothetical protein
MGALPAAAALSGKVIAAGENQGKARSAELTGLLFSQ